MGNRKTTLAASNARILFTMCLGIFIVQLDTSVVNLALKSIGATLDASLSSLQWVMDGYNLAYAGLLLTGGTLGDLFGRRRVFVAGMAVFTAGSVLCSAAPDALSLIASRAVTGVGAALLLPSSLAILSVAYTDRKERTHAIAIWASCNGLAFAIGPTLGGWMVEAFGWRSVFLLAVPVGVLAFLSALRCVPESAHPEGRRLDLTGQALAAVCLATFVFAAIEGAHYGWTAPAVVACFVASVAAGALFLGVEARTAGALVPLEFFRRPVLCASLAAAGLMTFGMYGMLFVAPLWLQALRGMSAVAAGTALLPMSVIFLWVSQRAGRFAVARGPRAIMATGMTLMGAGLLVLGLFPRDGALWAFEAALAVIGVGLGLNTGPLLAVAVASVPQVRSGTASGLVNTARMVGATLGVAVLGSLYAAYAGHGAAVENPDGIVMGMHAACIAGGCSQLLGALVVMLFVRRDSLIPVAA